MNRALLSIGSNDNAEVNISLCRQLLDAVYLHSVYSEMSVTAPYGHLYRNDFVNQLAVLYTLDDKDAVMRQLKSFEKKIGRRPDDKKTGLVKIDIDLVIWNDEVLKPEDMKRSYVADLLHKIQGENF